MIYEVHPEPEAKLHIDPEIARRAVRDALEVTIENLRARCAQAMESEQSLAQLFMAIQPDGTIHL